MSDDDFLERVDQSAKNWTGESRGPDQIESDFHLYGHTKRAEALDQLDEHLRTGSRRPGRLKASGSTTKRFREKCRPVLI
jgi:hypothetical protein